MHIWDCKTTEDLRKLEDRELLQCLIRSELMRKPTCKNCGNDMRQKFRTNRTHMWLCRRKGKDCSSVGMKNCSFFSQSHIKLVDQIGIAICWLNGVQQDSISAEFSMSRKTIAEQIDRLRDECVRYWNEMLLGGYNVAVQIGTVKVGGVHLVGAIERHKAGQAFVDVMTSVNGNELLIFLISRVQPTTYLLCDEWRNYNVDADSTNEDLFAKSTNEEIEAAMEFLDTGLVQLLHSNSDDDVDDLPLEIEQNDLIGECDDEVTTNIDFSALTAGLFGKATIDESNKETFSYGATKPTSSASLADLLQFVKKPLEDVDEENREKILAEGVMRFNGRQDVHRFFWEMVARHF